MERSFIHDCNREREKHAVAVVYSLDGRFVILFLVHDKNHIPDIKCFAVFQYDRVIGRNLRKFCSAADFSVEAGIRPVISNGAVRNMHNSLFFVIGIPDSI